MIKSRLFYAGLSKVFLIFYLDGIITSKGNDRLILYAVWCKKCMCDWRIINILFNLILNIIFN